MIKRSGSMRFQKMILPIKIVIVCIWYLYRLDFVFCDSKYYIYQRTEKLFLQSDFQTLQKTSVVGCCAYCSDTPGCESVSFKPSDGDCRLTAVPPVAILHDGSAVADWDTYSLKDGKLTTTVQRYLVSDLFFRPIVF